jgi:hypothetical protein
MKRSDFTSRDGNDQKGYKTNLDDMSHKYVAGRKHQ